MELSFRDIFYGVTDEDKELSVRRIMADRLHLSAREITRCKQFEDGVMATIHNTDKGYGLFLRGENTVFVDEEGRRFEAVMVKSKLSVGDTLRVRIYEDTDNASEIVPWDHRIDIVYEDEDMILLNKPGDMPAHPSYAHFADTLSNALMGYFEKTGQNHVIRTIGRLDRETSGLIIFAKNRHSAAVLSDQKKNMSRRKEYLALCSGVFEEKEGTIDAPIGQEEGVRMIRKVMDTGKEAITHFRVEEQFEDFALVRLWLDTGRTHQIRVHMQYIGHPLLGDNFYGDTISDHHGMKRAALFAAHLEFKHPVTGDDMSFDAEMPADMKDAMG